MILEILLGLGTNLSSEFLRSCAQKAVKSAVPIHNHDLQRAITIAFIEATRREWQSEELGRQYQENAEQIRAVFLQIHQNAPIILTYSQTNQLLDALVTDEGNRLTEILQPIIQPYLSDIS